jgi:hypothetical protein
MKRILAPASVLFLLWSVFAPAQTDAPLTVLWPSSDKPSLKLTFAKFQQSGMVDGQGIFVSEVTAQNILDQAMPRSVFTVFISNKDGVKIGRARLQLPEIPPFRTQKAQLQFSAAGAPAGVTLLAGKTIPLRVISVPAGANLKVDGEDAGTTPRVVDFTIGSHTLDFSKEGYAPGSTPLEVAADELPGGSISFELGGLSKDTVELRDGTVVLGDVLAMSMTAVTVRVEGKDQKYDRNQVKKILLVERMAEPKPTASPSPSGKSK